MPALVPFSDFGDLPGDEDQGLLGELEGLGGGPGTAAHTGLGLAPRQEEGLVPFMDFDPGLAGAGGLVGCLSGCVPLRRCSSGVSAGARALDAVPAPHSLATL